MKMIPKKIHYCWFGGKKLPGDVKKYIDTWKKYCPDYEIIEWNENNFDITENQYCKEAYEAKKWAFVSDYARLKILYENGGIYMDTDVEVCKSLNRFLKYDWFSGFESEDRIPTGTMGDLTTNVEVMTKILKENYKVQLNNTRQIFGDNNLLLPFDYLCAKSFFTGEISKTENTYTIHHFKGTWKNEEDKIKDKFRLFLVKYFGESLVRVIFKIKSSLR